MIQKVMVSADRYAWCTTSPPQEATGIFNAVSRTLWVLVENPPSNARGAVLWTIDMRNAPEWDRVLFDVLETLRERLQETAMIRLAYASTQQIAFLHARRCLKWYIEVPSRAN